MVKVEPLAELRVVRHVLAVGVPDVREVVVRFDEVQHRAHPYACVLLHSYSALHTETYSFLSQSELLIIMQHSVSKLYCILNMDGAISKFSGRLKYLLKFLGRLRIEIYKIFKFLGRLLIEIIKF